MAEDNNAFAALTQLADTEPAATENVGFLGDAAPAPPPPMPVAVAPPPPPAMPEPVPDPAAGPPPIDPADPAAPPPATGATMATTLAEPEQKTGGWEVDPWRLRSFGDAVVRARSYLDAVQMKVDRMQGAELTPQLGTSPVGEQLAKKFDDRLNSVDGLRAMLTEAMKRMDDFVTSAEKAAKAYEEADETAAETFENHEFEDEPAAKPAKPVKT